MSVWSRGRMHITRPQCEPSLFILSLWSLLTISQPTQFIQFHCSTMMFSMFAVTLVANAAAESYVWAGAPLTLDTASAWSGGKLHLYFFNVLSQNSLPMIRPTGSCCFEITRPRVRLVGRLVVCRRFITFILPETVCFASQ